MNISDELEKILNDMDEDEKRKLEESNTAKQMALLAEGGTPTGVSKKAPASNDLIHELRAQMYGADPVNTNMPTQQDFATQLMQYLSHIYFPGLVQQGRANVPTAAQGDYADVPSHANGGSIGYHQPSSLEQNMLALGGHRALPIIMALHKAAGGTIDGATQSPKPESPSADDSGGLFDPEMFGVPTGAANISDALEREYQSAKSDPVRYGADVLNRTVLPADLLGAPIDVTNYALKQVGLGSDKPFLGSHSIEDMMQSSGMVGPESHPVGETVAGLLDPTTSAMTAAKLAHGMLPLAGVLAPNLKNIDRLNELLTHSGDKVLPLQLPRANLSDEFINNEAERVAKQMLGEHVTSGKAGDTKNLAGRSMKESERVKGLDYKLSPTGTVAKEETYVPRKGDVLLAFPGDQTVSNKVLEELNGFPVNSVQEGGAYYGLGQKHLPDPEFWKSTEGPAKNVQGKANRIAEFYEPERVIGSHLAMGPTSNNFAMHLADANLKSIDWSKANPSQINMFDRVISNGYFDPISKKDVTFPDWPGIANPEAAMAAMKENSALRKWFNNRFKTPAVTKALSLPNGLDTQYAITEPRLRDMEINMTGLMNGVLKPNAPVEAAGNPHNTYSHRILGEAIGPQEALTPFSISFPDAAQHIASTKRPSDFTGTIQKVFPHQVVDDQYVNQYNQYLNRIKQLTGRKKGGKVKDPTEDKE